MAISIASAIGGTSNRIPSGNGAAMTVAIAPRAMVKAKIASALLMVISDRWPTAAGINMALGRKTSTAWSGWRQNLTVVDIANTIANPSATMVAMTAGQAEPSPNAT